MHLYVINYNIGYYIIYIYIVALITIEVTSTVILEASYQQQLTSMAMMVDCICYRYINSSTIVIHRYDSTYGNTNTL